MTLPLAAPGERLALITVGLPARGKTFLARRVARYLRWHGHDPQVFNVGNYRRERHGAQQGNAFFDPSNPEGSAARRRLAQVALDDMLAFFANGGQIAIYDATNSTRARRQWLAEQLGRAGIDALFVESICNDEAVLTANIRETKLASPDYAGWDPDEAVRDFRARIAHYEREYETMDEDNLSFVKVVDVGRRAVLNRVRGHLQSRIAALLLNVHITPRPIWLSRHGESQFNVAGRIGGDSALSPMGERYATTLSSFLDEWCRGESDLVVWTSTLRRARQTGAALTVPSQPWKLLDEIDAGVCDGWTYDEVAARMPDDYQARKRDKLRYRYPRGESYEDVISRLDPVILELERQRSPVVIVSHQAVLRALVAYLTDIPMERCPTLPVPLHTVIEIIPKAYGAIERRIPLLPGDPDH
jgi:broad specificity phosphatase PhoE